MVRLLIEDVTLIKDTGISIHIRFKGGVVQSLNLPAPMNAWQLRKTSSAVVSQIDQLLDQYTDAEIADILNKSGKVSGTGQPFNVFLVYNIRRTYGLKSRYERLRERNLFPLNELSKKLQVAKGTLKKWTKKNMLTTYKYNDKNERLYEWPGNEFINKLRDEKRQGRSKGFIELVSNRINEVQYEV